MGTKGEEPNKEYSGDAKHGSKNSSKKKSDKWLTVLQYVLIIFLAGVLLTPFIQNRQFQQRMNKEISEFREEDRTEEVSKMKENNEDMNKSGQFYMADPFAGQTKYEDRANMLGILEIPKIDETLTVYDRTDNMSLSEGVGLLEGTNLPTGGEGNTTVLTGHDGMAEATIFRNIDLLENGDIFTFDNGEEVLTYQVYDRVDVLPHETEYIKQIPGQDTMILLTCDTPDITKGVNTHRLIVYAERIPTVEDKVKEIEPVTNRDTRHIIFGISGLALVVGVIGKVTYNKIKKK